MADEPHRISFDTGLLLVLAWLALVLLPVPAAAAEFESPAPDMPLAKLRASLPENGRAILDLRVEGVVCAFSQHLRLVALQDDSATELLELPSLPAGLRPGNRLLIRANHCTVNRGTHAIQLGTAPVVELDEQHPAQSRSGIVGLKAGMQPFHLEWFSGGGAYFLSIEYSHEGTPRIKIPAEMFFHRDPGAVGHVRGLNYTTYIGEDWSKLPDFFRLPPQGRGVVADIDVSMKPAGDCFGIVFEGFLNVPATGNYDFQLTSDDGGRLRVGTPEVEASITAVDSPREIRTALLAQAIFAGSPDQWMVADGVVTFASPKASRLELELTENSTSFPATLLDPGELDPASLLQKRVQIAGIRRANGIVTLHPDQVKVIGDLPERQGMLKKAVQVRGLQREEANKPCPVELDGVVTMVSPRHLVLQDETGGVFIHYVCGDANSPRVGELWRVGGVTGSGDFSPVIHADRGSYLGNASLPTPVRPTREQLANGSLDAELVEIEGVVTEVADWRILLLTREGMVSMLDDFSKRMPANALAAEKRGDLVGSVIRMRGVYTANWDVATGRVRPAEVRMANTTLSIDEPAPRDPFSAPAIRASDLLLFTSQSSATKRVKVTGLLLHASPPQYLLFDGTRGFRIVTRDKPDLKPGDLVEAAGFPRLGGPSPVLLEAYARRGGSGSLPEPADIMATNLPDSRLDSTMVKIQGVLVSDTVRSDQRVLEMRAGSNHFFALVPSREPQPKPIERDSMLSLTGVYVSAQPDAALANPDPFEMRLLDASGIVVLQRGPWWTTRHTIALIAILSGGLVLASIWVTLLRNTVAKRSRELAMEIEAREAVERHRVMEQERTRVAQDLHDELGSGLTEAGILTSLVQNPAILQHDKDKYLEQLNDVCCTLVTGLDEIVWAVNPRYDSVADLAGYFSLFAQRFLGIAGIHCRLKIDDAIPEHPLDSRMRHGIFLAFKEALNNIVRHSGATEVHLSITAKDWMLGIDLADNGRGFDRAPAAPGSDGLDGMESRMEQLGGSCKINTNPGHGTSVRLRVPLDRKLIK